MMLTFRCVATFSSTALSRRSSSCMRAVSSFTFASSLIDNNEAEDGSRDKRGRRHDERKGDE